MDSQLRRTKIIATLGPATDAPGMLEKILVEGVDVVRMNLSHGAPEDHRKRCEAVRAAAAVCGTDLLGMVIAVEELAVASAAVVTVLAFVGPAFGLYTTIAGVLGLAQFLAVQPVGVALRDALTAPDRAVIHHVWAP